MQRGCGRPSNFGVGPEALSGFRKAVPPRHQRSRSGRGCPAARVEPDVPGIRLQKFRERLQPRKPKLLSVRPAGDFSSPRIFMKKLRILLQSILCRNLSGKRVEPWFFPNRFRPCYCNLGIPKPSGNLSNSNISPFMKMEPLTFILKVVRSLLRC